MAYYNLNAEVPFIKVPYPINNLIKITDPTQATTVNILLFEIWLTCSAWCLFQRPSSCGLPSPPKRHNTFSRLPMGHRDSSAITCNPCRQDLNYSHLSPGVQVSDYTDDVLFQGDSFDTLTFLY